MAKCDHSDKQIRQVVRHLVWGAAIAQWIRLPLPSSRPGFESQAHHLCFFQIIYLSFELECEKNENKQKRGRDWPIFKKNTSSMTLVKCM